MTVLTVITCLLQTKTVVQRLLLVWTVVFSSSSESDNQRFFELSCIHGACEECSEGTNYKKALHDFFEDIPENKTLNWSRWVKEEKEGKTKGIVTTERGKKEELIKEMVEKDILKPALRYTFSQHLFTGNWQAMMFSQIKSKLASDSVIPVLDFAKNRATISAPLRALTRKDATFTWGKDEQRSFDELKCRLANAETLGY
ncbi:Hypothetical predicted protein [Mytilus galloprovincialis]|uniref:Reverse transcriptase/retrotransposon-derived protein RNase H-like domain-containing protein n=1 Tax=Mytilus galloprovincialis TaxID=29158 RepID=A0A8B6C2L6_MYTGA|nr:Hypothetical predicted protein [Mytilus galloprovincialis]